MYVYVDYGLPAFTPQNVAVMANLVVLWAENRTIDGAREPQELIARVFPWCQEQGLSLAWPSTEAARTKRILTAERYNLYKLGNVNSLFKMRARIVVIGKEETVHRCAFSVHIRRVKMFSRYLKGDFPVIQLRLFSLWSRRWFERAP